MDHHEEQIQIWSDRVFPTSWRRKGAERGVNNGSRPCDEATIKIPVLRGSASFCVGEHFYTQEGDGPQLHRDGAS